MKSAVVIWPVILKYAGENELTFISNQSEWDCDADLHFFSYDPEDMLIDSEGFIHSLKNRKNNVIAPEPTNRSLSLQEVIALGKAHLSELGSCCVSKFSAHSIQHAIDIVGASNEQ